MIEFTHNQFRVVFFSIEINLILWLVVNGFTWMGEDLSVIKTWTTIGVIGSALLQHWAYYRIYKKARSAPYT